MTVFPPLAETRLPSPRAQAANMPCIRLPLPLSDPARQAALNAFYVRRLAPPAAFAQVPDDGEVEAFRAIERTWNLQEEARLDLASLPVAADEFPAWYQRLHRHHREEAAPFFEYLAESATIEELALYVSLEEQVDGRFDDVVSLAQLGMTGDMKLALAENYWDEMGLGRIEDMHTRLFARSAAHMRQHLHGLDVAAMVPVEAVRNGNLLLMYALDRRFTPRLLGALAILEHTAPYRFSRTVRGLRRLRVPEDVVHYHELHVEVDANHGKQLFERVLQPLVAQSREAMREVCIGCLIRFNVATDYYRSLARTMDELRQGRTARAAAGRDGAA